MTPILERVNASIDAKALAHLLEREGAVVVEGALGPSQLEGLNSEVDDVIAATAPGLRSPAAEEMVEFYGHHTIRLDGLPSASSM